MNRGIALMLGLALVAGCESTTPPPPAVTSFAPAMACTDAPSLAGAASLTPQEPSGRMELIVDVTAEGNCLRQASGQQAPYTVFALPTEGKVASVSAGALLEPYRLLPPIVSTLRADGSIARTFAADDFNRRGRSIAVLFAPRPDEKYILIAVDAARVGGAHSLIAGDPAGVPVPARYSTPEAAAGFKASLSRPYSYAGQVFARVYFSDPAL